MNDPCLKRLFLTQEKAKVLGGGSCDVERTHAALNIDSGLATNRRNS
jgi:hypothetical protein